MAYQDWYTTELEDVKTPQQALSSRIRDNNQFWYLGFQSVGTTYQKFKVNWPAALPLPFIWGRGGRGRGPTPPGPRHVRAPGPRARTPVSDRHRNRTIRIQ